MHKKIISHRGSVKEYYLACLILDGAEKGHFGTINTDLDNKMACGSEIYPKIKYETVGLLKN